MIFFIVSDLYLDIEFFNFSTHCVLVTKISLGCSVYLSSSPLSFNYCSDTSFRRDKTQAIQICFYFHDIYHKMPAPSKILYNRVRLYRYFLFSTIMKLFKIFFLIFTFYNYSIFFIYSLVFIVDKHSNSLSLSSAS